MTKDERDQYDEFSSRLGDRVSPLDPTSLAGAEGEADRQLISPDARLEGLNAELLAALKAYRSARPQCDCSAGSGCSMADARAAADEAIAKAEVWL